MSPQMPKTIQAYRIEIDVTFPGDAGSWQVTAWTDATNEDTQSSDAAKDDKQSSDATNDDKQYFSNIPAVKGKDDIAFIDEVCKKIIDAIDPKANPVPVTIPLQFYNQALNRDVTYGKTTDPPAPLGPVHVKKFPRAFIRWFSPPRGIREITATCDCVDFTGDFANTLLAQEVLTKIGDACKNGKASILLTIIPGTTKIIESP